jgi:hypothetical protein
MLMVRTTFTLKRTPGRGTNAQQCRQSMEGFALSVNIYLRSMPPNSGQIRLRKPTTAYMRTLASI